MGDRAMMILIDVLIVLTLINICGQIATMRKVRTLQQRMDAILTARQSFREGSKQLRARLDARFGIRK